MTKTRNADGTTTPRAMQLLDAVQEIERVTERELLHDNIASKDSKASISRQKKYKS